MYASPFIACIVQQERILVYSSFDPISVPEDFDVELSVVPNVLCFLLSKSGSQMIVNEISICEDSTPLSQYSCSTPFSRELNADDICSVSESTSCFEVAGDNTMCSERL